MTVTINVNSGCECLDLYLGPPASLRARFSRGLTHMSDATHPVPSLSLSHALAPTHPHCAGAAASCADWYSGTANAYYLSALRAYDLGIEPAGEGARRGLLSLGQAPA